MPHSLAGPLCGFTLWQIASNLLWVLTSSTISAFMWMRATGHSTTQQCPCGFMGSQRASPHPLQSHIRQLTNKICIAACSQNSWGVTQHEHPVKHPHYDLRSTRHFSLSTPGARAPSNPPAAAGHHPALLGCWSSPLHVVPKSTPGVAIKLAAKTHTPSK